MLEFMMPAALVIASNVIYQICAKGVPADIDPLGIGDRHLSGGCRPLTKVGWPISMLTVVQSGIVALLLVLVGYLLYHEQITLTKLAGIGICLLGLYFMNR